MTLETEPNKQTDNSNHIAKETKSKSVFVIFNPVSGTEDPEHRKKMISEALTEHGYECQFLETTEERSGKELAEQALKEGVDLITVSGGDGTVIETISALVGSDIPLAVFPAGTGNLLSVNLGIPKTVPEAVHVALSGQPYKLDLARTNDGRYFAIMGGLGIDAYMIADAGRAAKRRFGVLAYLVAAIKNLGRRGMLVELRIDDGPLMRRYAKSVIIANMGKITGGLEVMPTARPNDGVLNIGVLRSATLNQWLRLLGFALLGRAHEDPDFDVLQGRRIEIHTSPEQAIEFDGEEGGTTSHLVVEVVPHAVNILLPEGSSAQEDVRAPLTSAQVQAMSLPGRIILVAGIAGLIVLGLKKWRRWKTKD